MSVVDEAPPTPAQTAAAEIDCELRSVSKRYPDGTAAVNDVSLAIARGEFFSLLGPSGCGKSTTLRMIGGLDHPTGGSVLIRGREMTGVAANRRPTNMVFQHLALFPHLDVAHNISFGLRLRRRPRAEVNRRVEEALELVRLPGYGRRRVGQLSGGQQQRVAIARALVNEPAVLLLDEPLGALDLRLRLEMQRSLKEIQRTSGTTFIYVTHDQQEAFTMSDRVGVMSDGALLQVGTPEDLYQRPGNRFVATFVGDTNLITGTATGDGFFEAPGLRVRAQGRGSALSVRPERIRIGARSELAADSRLEGRVIETIYLGASTRYVVDLGAGQRLLVDAPNSGAGGVQRAGAEVAVGWDIASGVLIDD